LKKLGAVCDLSRMAEPTETPAPRNEELEPVTLEVPLNFVKRGGATRILPESEPRPRFEPSIALSKARTAVAEGNPERRSGKPERTRQKGRRRQSLPQAHPPGRLSGPTITEAIVEGTQPASLSLEQLRKPIPLDWVEQRRSLGFDGPL
jgi:hypothetical protein